MAGINLLCHRHHMITCQLPGLDPALQRVQGLLIATHIGEVAVELRQDREVKALSYKENEKKGIPDLLGYHLTYFLRLGQIAAHKDPLHLKGDSRPPKVSSPYNASDGL